MNYQTYSYLSTIRLVSLEYGTDSRLSTDLTPAI
jgi:hypothetical protein